MKRAVLVAVAALWPIAACAQTNPGLMPGLSYTAPQISALFANKVDTVNGKASGLVLTGGSLSGTAVDGATVGGVALSTALANAAASNVGLSTSQLALLNGALQATSNLSGSPVTVNGTASTVGSAISSNATAVAGAMTQLNNEVTRAEAAEALKVNTSALGTVAALNTGTASGNVPVIGSNGLLPASVVPSSGSASVTSQSISSAGGLLGSNNLSDLTTPATARTNLGLGSAAVANIGTASGNVPTLPLTASEIPALSYASLTSPAFTGAPTAPTQTTGDTSADLSTDAFVVATLSAGLQSALVNTSLTGVPTAPTASSSTSTTQLATTAFVQNLVAGVSGGASAAYTPSGGTTAVTPAAVEGRVFDPRSYGATVSGSFTSIGSVFGSSTTPESLAASNSAYAFLTDARTGLKFTLTVTSVIDGTHFLSTYTPPNYVAPQVTGVPQFQSVYALSAQLLPGEQSLTDTTTSGVSLGNVSAAVWWPEYGTPNASSTATPGTITVTGSTTGLKANDSITVEILPASFVAKYSVDWLGVEAAIWAADHYNGGATVNAGPGYYHMGQGAIWTYRDNPVRVLGNGFMSTFFQWDTPAQEDGFYMGDYIGYNPYRFNSRFEEFSIGLASVPSQTYGTAADTGVLLLLGQNSSAHNVSCNGGYACVGALGDHQIIDRIVTQNVFYGLSFLPFNDTNGNVDLQHSQIQAAMAGVGISWGAAVNDGVFGGDANDEWGNLPHIIFHEPDFNTTIIPSSIMDNGGLTNVHWDWTPMEYIGGTPIEMNGGNWEGNKFDQFLPGMNSSLYISSETKAYFIHTTGTCGSNKVSQSDFNTTAGNWPTTAWIYCGSYQGDDWGDMSQTINYSGIPMLEGPNPNQVGGEVWEDHIWRNASGSSIGGYQLITGAQNYDYAGAALGSSTLVTEGQNGGNTVSRFASSGNAAIQDVVGVTIGTQPTWGHPVLVVRAGQASVMHETTTATTAIAGGRVYTYGPTPTAGVTVSTTTSNQAGPEIGTLFDASPSSSASYVDINLFRH